MQETSVEELVKRLRESRSDELRHGLTFVITGANSGIGLEACKLLARLNPTNRIVLVARNQEKAVRAKDMVVQSVWPDSTEKEVHSMNLIPLGCDHCSFASVEQFTRELRRKLDETYSPSKWATNGVDVLCLNAAVLQQNDSEAVFTEDGYEVTFQTNHLAPFLIANRLTSMMNPGGRIVFSTSGLFYSQKLVFDGASDPTTGAIRKGFQMLDGSDFHYKRSYSLAKLCNVAVCLELNQRIEGITTNCFSPGLMTASGLFRNQPRSGKSIATIPNSKAIFAREKTVLWGAGSLVYMAIADATGEEGGQYWRDADSFAGSAAVYGQEFCPTSIPEDVITRNQRSMLWDISCQCTNLSLP